jgi:hypothetical protein
MSTKPHVKNHLKYLPPIPSFDKRPPTKPKPLKPRPPKVTNVYVFVLPTHMSDLTFAEQLDLKIKYNELVQSLTQAIRDKTYWLSVNANLVCLSPIRYGPNSFATDDLLLIYSLSSEDLVYLALKGLKMKPLDYNSFYRSFVKRMEDPQLSPVNTGNNHPTYIHLEYLSAN